MNSRHVLVLVGTTLLGCGIAAPSSADETLLTFEEGVEMSDELESTSDEWAGDAAEDIVAIAPHEGGVLILAEPGSEETIADMLPATSSDVTVVPGGYLELNGAPSADAGGWSGGNWLDGATSRCTAGFAWKAWANARVVGSTAAHCGGGSWRNNGRLVGTVGAVGTANNDVESISPAANTSFTADVWIRGSNGTPVLRVVQDAARNTVGETVGFYGRTSGGGHAKITSTSWNGQAGRIYGTTSQPRPGDSGGPVYATHANGRVQARGTVSAMTYQDNNRSGTYDAGDTVMGLIFTDVTYTSANLKATLYTP